MATFKSLNIFGAISFLPAVIVLALFDGLFSACTRPSDITEDEEIELIGDEISARIDSLVYHQHPDPVAFLDSVYHSGPAPGFIALYTKYESINHYYRHIRDFETALVYADSSLQLHSIYDVSGGETYRLYTLLTKGDILMQMQYYGAAFQVYRESWELIQSRQDPCLTAVNLRNLSSISYNQDKFRDAIEYIRQARDAFLECGSDNEFQGFFNEYGYAVNTAEYYQSLGIADSTLYYTNYVLDLISEYRGRLKRANNLQYLDIAGGVTIGNQGEAHLMLGDSLQAENAWKESIVINSKPGFDNEHAHLMRLHLAGYYIDKGRMEDAKSLLDSVREFRENTDTNNREMDLRWLRLEWNWQNRWGNLQDAYEAYQNYAIEREAAHQKKDELQALDINQEIDYIRQNNAILRLETESQLKDFYLSVIVWFIALIAVVLLLIWQNWRRQKKNVFEFAGLGKQLFRKNMQLEKSNKTITRIMNMVAHDLRNPMGGIMGLSSMMREDENLTNEQKNWIQLMHTSSGQAMKLINEMMHMDIDEFVANKKTIKKERVDISEFLRQSIQLLQFRADEKKQNIILKNSDELMVEFNKDKMFRVINNIVGNAIKFSPDGSSIFVEAVPGSRGKGVKIRITDQGIGIPDGSKDKIFDTFTDAKRPGTRGEESFGLGLSISKQIVEAHGGGISFESKEGAGTTFFIELPYSETSVPAH